jgi:hypothetical protein
MRKFRVFSLEFMVNAVPKKQTLLRGVQEKTSMSIEDIIKLTLENK